ncbi:class C sortase [Schaalia suimastitidis]|uniref:class C sortase n=1 Tax=Schaalia suimastitidis TaxID=121163 RepID=UPI0004296572|nr:class C sortase [Schaalia suimastitidis]
MGRHILAGAAAVVLIAGVTMLLYPSAAQWVSYYNQSRTTSSYAQQIGYVDPRPDEQIAAAQRYNDALSSGALIEANTNVPTSSQPNLSASIVPYAQQLYVDGTGLMARIRIPKINVDLPVYHGTSDDVLLRGAGHLEGTSLPVGGVDTRTVITGHRGLASSRMFTDLDQLQIGDSFTIETFGLVLSYRVTDIIVVDPDDRESISTVAGKDLATLVTCTPLGINSHRIIVTGERIVPTPSADLKRAGQVASVPFPWWMVIWVVCSGTIIVGIMALTRDKKRMSARHRGYVGPRHLRAK